MKYICEYCNYETGDKGNWSKHKKSKKHLGKSIEDTKTTTIFKTRDFIEVHRGVIEDKTTTLLNGKLVDINKINNLKSITCAYCNIEFSKTCYLSRHLKFCAIKKNNDQLKEKDIELKEKNNEVKIKLLEEKIKSIEKEKKYIEYEKNSIEMTLKEQINMLKTENNFHKQLINSAGGLIGKSMSTMSYLLLNHNDAPVLKPLVDYSIISKDDETLIKNLVYHNRKGTLEKYMGDFIVEQYKKDDPDLQAIWSSDTERLNYFIRELTKTKDNEDIIDKNNKKNENDKDKKKIKNVNWSVDKKGIKVMESIIEPLLHYIQKISTKYINDKSKEIEYIEVNEAINTGKDMQDIGIIICGIKNKSIAFDINKYIAPHFYLNKNEGVIVEKNSTQI